MTFDGLATVAVRRLRVHGPVLEVDPDVAHGLDRRRVARVPHRLLPGAVRSQAQVRLLLLIIAPFLTSYLLRVLAWKVILGDGGVVDSFLSWTGVREPTTRSAG